jgi:hypothetical protein
MGFENALTELQQALSVPSSRDHLRELWSKVQEFKMTVPHNLEDRYTERITELRKEAVWRERMILAVTFAIGAIILVGFLLFAMMRPR